MKRYLPHIQILLAGFLWGIIGIFNRNLYAFGLSSVSVVALRNIGGLLVLGLILLVYDRSIFKISLRHLPIFFGTGIVSILLFTLCYFTSQQLGSLAVSAILLYTAPAFVVMFSFFLFKDRLTKRKLLALLFAFLGCVFVSGVLNGDVSVTSMGLLLGLGSGFFYSLYSIFGRYALKHYRPLTVTFYSFLFAGVGSAFLIQPPQLSRCIQDGHSILLILGLVVISTVLPYIFYTRGLSETDSGKASILATIEPVVAAFTGVFVFQEPLTVVVIVGLICILISVYILK